jgi:hypothetical protein
MGITVVLAVTAGAILFSDIAQTVPFGNDYEVETIENGNVVALASLGLIVAGIAGLIGLIRRLMHR